jgi:hypothetical protein
MCSREAKFSLSLHCFSAGVYILFQSLNIVFIASLQSPFVLCDSRALPRMCFNTTCSFGIKATYTCSALYRPCLLVWIAPMGVPTLLNIWHTSMLNTTLHLVHMIQLTDTIVIPMSEACKMSLRMIGVKNSPLGTSILRSPMPTA